MVIHGHIDYLLALIFTVFFCCYSSEVNITFHNNATTWIGAVEYCASIGAVLYSDEQYILNQTEYYEVWTGNYNALTPWKIIWGCYEIDFKKAFPIYGDQPECQKKCTSTDFFALKDTRCVCLQQTDLRNEHSISPCNCSKCVQVLKHGFVNVREGNPTCMFEDKQCCMAAACLDDKLKLTSERCSNLFRIICDDHADGGHTSYQDGNTYCFNKNSILRRYKRENLCPTETEPHWTSGLSTVYGYTLQYKDNISNLNPRQCLRVAHTNTNGMEYVQCNKVFPFYCQAGSIVYEDNFSSKDDGQSNDSNTTADSSATHSYSDVYDTEFYCAIGGSISAILITVIVVVTGFLLYRRRIPSRTLLSLNSIVKDEPSTSRNDGYTVNAAYEQLNKADKDQRKHVQAYDRLHAVHVADTTIKTRMSIEDESKYDSIDEKNEKYNNAVTSDYDKLDLAHIEQIKNMYDPLHYKHFEDSDPTNARSNTIGSNDENRKYEPSASKIKIDSNSVPLEYEQLDITKTDTSTRAYDKLHNSHPVDSEPTNDRPNIIISREEQTNDKSSEDRKEMDTSIVSPEYEQLDITKKIKS